MRQDQFYCLNSLVTRKIFWMTVPNLRFPQRALLFFKTGAGSR